MSNINDYSMLSRGDLIKTFRKKAGLTQIELAYFVGKHEKTICRYEKNRENIPDSVFYEIGYVLKIPKDILSQCPESVENNKFVLIDRKKTDNMLKGKFIRAKRKKAGITQIELASLVDMNNVTLSAYENGTRNINTVNFNLLCRALAVDEKEKKRFLRNGQKKTSTSLNKVYPCNIENMTKGEFIRAKRKTAGITQAQLASLVDMSACQLSDFENNKGNIGIIKFDLLCEALDVDKKEKEKLLQNEQKRILEQLNKVFPCDTASMTIGEQVLYLRMLNNWSLVQLSVMSGLSVNGIRKIENNTTIPRKSTIRKLSKALGADLKGNLHYVKG